MENNREINREMKKCYTRLYLFLPLFIFCFALLKYSNVNAATYSITSGTLYRAFSACPRTGNCTFTANNSTFTTVPTSALQSRNDNLRYINGLFTSGTISQGSTSQSVNTISNVYFIFTQEDVDFADPNDSMCVDGSVGSYFNYGQNSDSSESMRPRLRFYNGSTLLNVQYVSSVSCSLNANLVEVDLYFTGYSTTDNTPITSFDFKWGDINTPTQPFPAIAGIRSANNNPSSMYGGSVNYLGMVYDYTTSNDPNAAYQSTIINQNNTMINQNQQIINNQNAAAQQDQEDRDNISDTAQDAQDSADSAQDQNEQATSSLLDTMGALFTALGTPATDCKVNADLGNIDLGEIDYCSGKPAAFEPIINSVCVMIMAIPIYLIARDIMLRFIYLTSYAQGGDNVR